ncbi:hypothetical protein NQ318_020944 [Aromia moschata]|uniref:Mpv17-like protein n=1 Tax=Aromia moschata TaxID=1265417 RepID=A0AAV8Y2U6_9CUCU|nr:hypothetical protein NQ318_020944 [Aromia moschata]
MADLGEAREKELRKRQSAGSGRRKGREDVRVRLRSGTRELTGRANESSRREKVRLKSRKRLASKRFAAFVKRHPVIRGMISYGTIWPTSCIIQETMAGKTWENYDWMRAARFSLYGCFFTAPTLYAWIRLSTILWPTVTLRTSITKAIVEQMSYGPAALICFYFGMNLIEGKTIEEAKMEVKNKFLPSYKVGICFWPVLQTVNFYYIKEKNRVPFVSACSLVWCCFLAYMHQLQFNKQLTLPQNT